MNDALIKRVSLTYKCNEMYVHRGKNVQEMDAILLIVDIVNGVCRFVIKSVQHCRYFLFLWICFWSGLITDKEPCKFAVNKRQNTNYSFLPVSNKVSCIRKKRSQIICLQGKYLMDGNFRSQKAKNGSISCLMWNIYLYFIILKLSTNFQKNIFF